jgi:hypothetical protein
MPFGWSGGPDLCDQIWFKVGLLFFFPKLRWSEMGETRRANVSFNKVGFSGYLLVRGCPVLELLLASLGGVGRGRLRGSIYVFSRLLHLGVFYMADKLAAMIFGRSGGPSRRRCAGVSSTSYEEAPSGDARRISASSRGQVVRPRRRKKTGDGISQSVERTEDSIAFSTFFLGSFVLIVRTTLYLFIFQGPVCKIVPTDSIMQL